MSGDEQGSSTLRVCSGVPVARSHSRTVVSPEPLAMYRPLGLNCTDNTASACPVQKHWCVRRASEALQGSQLVTVVCSVAFACSISARWKRQCQHVAHYIAR